MTRAPQLGSDDFLAAAQDLLPRGHAWPRDPGATLTLYWQAVSDQLAAMHGRALRLLEVESDPANTDEALADWERAFGLPDPCSGPAPTVQQRRAELVARLTASGGSSIAYFVGVAAALGYTITIEEFQPAVADGLVADGPAYSDDWAHAWLVRAPETTVTEFVADGSYADEPLATWGNQTLECVLTRIRPGHTVLIFAYGS